MKVELDIECPDCKGTGLYVGFAERDGYAVVCHKCKGSGKFRYVMEYEPFSERKPREGIHTVVQVNPGYQLGGEKGKLDFGGMPYSDWASGKDFPAGSEMRRCVCPACWYQNADYDKMPKWEECFGCGRFSDCKSFAHKSECWERWDKEHTK